jgi:hypothetical protein
MTPEAVALAIRANLAWGDAREYLGRVRERADADPTETNGAAEADALAVERRAWRQWQAALVAAGFGPMPATGAGGDD